MKNTIALILGGGAGKRLFPLTRDRAKPAVPIGGKYRLIDIPISNCLNSEVRKIFVVTQFNSESLNNHISQAYKFDYFSDTTLTLLAAEQTLENANWFQGTADAVRKNLVHLRLRGDENIIILSGDHLYAMDYREILEFHKNTNADLTISVTPIKTYDSGQFGILKLDKNSRISSFKEKPKHRRELKGYLFGKNECLASMGVYVFKAKALIDALESDYLDFGKQLIPSTINKARVYGFIFKGYWQDIGTISSFYEANIALTKKNPQFSFYSQGHKFYSRPRFLAPAKIENATIVDSIITEGSFIKNSSIKNSIIGLRSIIGRSSKIENSIIMGADYYENKDPLMKNKIPIGIGDGSIIKKAIIDKNARIGKKVKIVNIDNLSNFDGENFFIRDKIVIIPKNSLIKDGALI